MKKVVSALTAAAMCASMAAGAASVFAYYDTPDMTFSLRVMDMGEGYNISADGSTITFDSAEAAANAKFVVGQYLECDPSKVLIQQVNGCVTVSSDLVKLPDAGISLADPYYSATKEYTSVKDVTFSTDCFVNTFGYTNKLKKYKSGAAVETWGNSTTWPAAWGYADANKHLIWTWASSMDDSTYDDYTTTAHFLGANSDDYPLMGFEVTLDAAITDGTYTIEWVETYTNDYGEAQATFFSAGTQNTPEGIPVMTPVGTLKDLTIVVGDASTTEPSETEPVETQPSETEPSETEPSSDDVTEPSSGSDEYTWDINDATVDADGYAIFEVYVTNDPGTNGYTVLLEIEDKNGNWTTLNDFGLTYIDGERGGAYPKLNTFAINTEMGYVGATNGTAEAKENQFAVAGEPVFTLYYEVPSTIEDGVYNIRFSADSEIIDAAGTTIFPVMSQGTLTVGDPEPTEPSETEPSETEPSETEPSETEPSETEPSETAGDVDYLYGDVNKNGKVELVDIVMLNRYLTGYGDQKLDDYQMEVANCYYDDARDGKDSIEILKFLIGLTTALPTKA